MGEVEPLTPGVVALLREALHRPAVLHRPGCAEGDLLDRLTRDESFMECSCGGTSQFQDALRDAPVSSPIPSGSNLTALSASSASSPGLDVAALNANIERGEFTVVEWDLRASTEHDVSLHGYGPTPEAARDDLVDQLRNVALSTPEPGQ